MSAVRTKLKFYSDTNEALFLADLDSGAYGDVRVERSKGAVYVEAPTPEVLELAQDLGAVNLSG